MKLFIKDMTIDEIMEKLNSGKEICSEKGSDPFFIIENEDSLICKKNKEK